MKPFALPCLLLLSAAGCHIGNPRDKCDPTTFSRQCLDRKTVGWCATKGPMGAHMPFPTIARLDCGREVCTQEGDYAVCVADPPTRCHKAREKRCHDGLEQKCLGRGLGLDQEPLFWRAQPSFSCVEGEALENPEGTTTVE